MVTCLNILLVSRGILPLRSDMAAGTEHALFNVSRGLAARGHSVIAVTDVMPGAAQELSGIHIRRVGMPARLAAYAMRAGLGGWAALHLMGNVLASRVAASAVRDHVFDIVDFWGPLSANLLARGLLRHRGLVRVFTENDGSPFSSQYASLWEQTLRRLVHRVVNIRTYPNVDHVIVVQSAIKRELVQQRGIPVEKVSVIPNGVDTRIFCPSPRWRLGPGGPADPESDFLLFVGRLSARKRVDTLLRAMPRCHAPLVIVGDGPERARLERMCRDLGVSSRVAFTGLVNHIDLPRYYSGCLAFVLPSCSEGLPLTLIEAMSCGAPVICAPVPGLSDLIEHGWNGFLVEPEDHDTLLSHISRLREEPELRSFLGQNARSTILRSFTWDRIAEQREELYWSLLRSRRAAAS